MSIKAMILYGSCARGEQTSTSDVDLLGIHSEPFYKMIVSNKVNIALYSYDKFSQMMMDGELFAYHIFSEAQVLYDSDKTVSKLLELFRLKESYWAEVTEANLLAWIIIKFYDKFSHYKTVNRRIIWCIRTICAAKLAEQNTPCFSWKAIVQYTQNSQMEWIIQQKENPNRSDDLIILFKSFLVQQGLEIPSSILSINEIKEAKAFFKPDSMGAKFLCAIDVPNSNRGYT